MSFVRGTATAQILEAMGAASSPTATLDDVTRWLSTDVCVAAVDVAAPQDERLVVTYELDGSEGIKPAVVRAASRNGAYASVHWNVEGLVILTVARKRRILFADEWPPEDGPLPRPLRAAARSAASLDPVSAALVVAMSFTGLATGQRLGPPAGRVWHPVTEPRMELMVDPAFLLATRWPSEELAEAIARLGERGMRELAQWAALTAVASRDLDADVVSSITSQFGGTATPRWSPIAALLLGAIERSGRQLDRIWEETPDHERRVNHLVRDQWALESLAYTTLRDPHHAALGAVYVTALAVGPSSSWDEAFLRHALQRAEALDPQR